MQVSVVSPSDHPYFAERVHAYAALSFVLGASSNVAGAVIVTNLLSRPAPILARSVTGLSTISRGRFVLGLGAGGMWEEIVALGVPRLSPRARIRALEEAMMIEDWRIDYNINRPHGAHGYLPRSSSSRPGSANNSSHSHSAWISYWDPLSSARSVCCACSSVR
jgi:hypothetical protein